MKKKPVSLQPYAARMQQRAQQARALPMSEQGAFYYCGGRNKTEFAAAVAAGETEALTLALNVVAGELWLCPRDGARYARSIRAALRTACEAGLMDEACKRILYAAEMRNLERLVLRGRHSAPGVLQQRAARRAGWWLRGGSWAGSAGLFWPQMPRSVAMWMSSAAFTELPAEEAVLPAKTRSCCISFVKCS